MLLSVGSTVHFRKIVHFTKMPKNRLVTRSVTNSRPPHMTLNLECTEEPLSEAQLMLRLELKENYDRVAATLEELVKDHGANSVFVSSRIPGLQILHKQRLKIILNLL